MRTGRPQSSKATRVVVLTADAEFDASARATFGASSAIDLDDGDRQHRRDQADTLDVTGATVVVVDLDANDAAEMAALSRLMVRVGAWPPVIAVTQKFRRKRRPHAVADADRRLPGQAGGADRSGARLRARRQRPARRRQADRGADLHLPARRRRRRRHHAGDADRDAVAQFRRPARQAVDLPGRSRFPARRGRRLSRSRAAAQSRRDRTAPGPARPAIARDHAVLSFLRAGGDRGAEPARRNAFVRSRRGDAAARSGLDQFRICRVRHAAHLVLLDRQRAARLQQIVHRQRDHGAGLAPRQATW